MDDEYLFNEKQSIRDSSRSLKKYGSTCCNHIRNNETLVRHEIEKTDTLQGIALKYGCSTEQIRRANRLFASDSLFLRQYLMVPIEKSSPFYAQALAAAAAAANNTTTSATPTTDENNCSANNIQNTNNRPVDNQRVSPDAGNANNNSRPSTTNTTNNSTNNCNSALPARPYSIAGELLIQSGQDDDAALNCPTASSSKQSKSLDSVAAMTPDEENRKCINDFLNKIDATITESRKYVEKSKEMITSQSDNDLFVSNSNTSDDFMERNSGYQRQNQQNNSYRNHQQHHMRQSSSGSNSDTAYLLNTTQLRRVQNSLKRMEKQQDEFFEL